MAGEETGENQGCCKRCCHLGYFKTLDGVGKMIEFAVVILGLILMATVSATNATAIKFFIFVHSTGAIFIAIHIVLNVLGLFNRLPLLVISNFTYMILCAIAALVFLICSAITLDKYGDNVVKGASVLGLVAMGLFILETVYHFIQHQRGGSRKKTEMKETTETKHDIPDEQAPNY